MLEAIVKSPISVKAKAAAQAAQIADHTTPLIRICWYVAALEVKSRASCGSARYWIRPS